MSVNAIQQLAAAEEQAAKLIQDAENQVKAQREQSDQDIKLFEKNLLQEEKDEQKQIRQKYADELIRLKTPLIERMNKQEEELKTITPAMREKALSIIVDKVVG